MQPLAEGVWQSSGRPRDLVNVYLVEDVWAGIPQMLANFRSGRGMD